MITFLTELIKKPLEGCAKMRSFYCNYIWNEISKYEYVSFDIFDTLVKRNVKEPKEIFRIVASKHEVRDIDFVYERIRAEKIARSKKLGSEVSLDEIYCEIPIAEEEKKSLQALEIEIEYQACVPNYAIKNIYDKCIENGKTVIITSDMYLPEDVIVRILQNCDYDNYYKLYLSSTLGKQKCTGKLFEYILSDLNIDCKKMVHIGDNKKADILLPLKNRIRPIFINRYDVNTAFCSREEIFESNTNMFTMVNNLLPKYSKCTKLYKWGYEAYGPLILGFCYWINDMIQEKKISKVYFLARDMYHIMKIFKFLFPNVEINYLEVSRKSMRRSYVIKTNNVSSVFDTMARKQYSILDVCVALGINPNRFVNECANKGLLISIEDLFPDITTLLYSKINEIILNILLETPDYTYEYLNQMGMTSDEKIAIVDIGWHGTIQNMLETITGEKYIGFYFGSTVRSAFKKMELYGYWYDAKNENQILSKLTMIPILEVMLFPQIGTTISYQKIGGKISPIYGECEMDERFSLINDFQNGSVQFVKDYIAYNMDSENGIDVEISTKNYEKLAFSPSYCEARILAELPYEEGKVLNIVQHRKWYCYILKPQLLLDDYRLSKWKTGFLKLLFPLIKNPHKIDSFIKKRKVY